MILENGTCLEMRHAECDDMPAIMDIIGQARRRLAGWGIDQWQDGYPDEASIVKDLENGDGRVFMAEGRIAAYAALVLGDDPAYGRIDGEWPDSLPYIVVHRVAVHDGFVGLGIARAILQYAEAVAVGNGISRFRIDTHRGNRYMTRLILHSGFTFCGVVRVRGGFRDAYAKPVKPHGAPGNSPESPHAV